MLENWDERLAQVEPGQRASLLDRLVEELAREIGLLQGRPRAVHLGAHLEIQDVLTSTQVDRYMTLRGYAGHQH
jgi:hypothetical protein